MATRYQPGPSAINSLLGLPGSTPGSRLAAGLMSASAVAPVVPEVAAADGETTAAGNAARSSAPLASQGLKALAKDATAGALFSTLLGGGYFKYAAIWVGLFVLALVLLVKGLGVSTPSATKIIPVPA